MRQCTFKAVDKTGECFNSIIVKTNSYYYALETAIEWFSKLNDKESLHLSVKTDFENKIMTKENLLNLLSKLESSSCGDYLVVDSENYISEIKDGVKIAVLGSARPGGVVFPFTGSNNKIYRYIDKSKNTRLKSLLNDIPTLQKELDKLGIVFIDVAKSFLIAKGFCGDNDILGFVIDNEILIKLQNAQSRNQSIVVVPSTGNAKHILNNVYKIKTYKLLSLVDQYRSYEDEWVELITKTI